MRTIHRATHYYPQFSNSELHIRLFIALIEVCRLCFIDERTTNQVRLTEAGYEEHPFAWPAELLLIYVFWRTP